MIRKTLIIISFLLAVMAVTLWVRSYFRSIYISHSSANTFVYVFSDVGHFALSIDDRQSTGLHHWTADWSFPSDGVVADFTFKEMSYYRQICGFAYAYAKPIRAGRIQATYLLTLPHWFIALFFATYPTIAFIRGPYRRYRRRKNGLCLKCGYNLTGNVSGVCPECGEQI